MSAGFLGDILPGHMHISAGPRLKPSTSPSGFDGTSRTRDQTCPFAGWSCALKAPPTHTSPARTVKGQQLGQTTGESEVSVVRAVVSQRQALVFTLWLRGDAQRHLGGPCAALRSAGHVCLWRGIISKPHLPLCPSAESYSSLKRLSPPVCQGRRNHTHTRRPLTRWVATSENLIFSKRIKKNMKLTKPFIIYYKNEIHKIWKL